MAYLKNCNSKIRKRFLIAFILCEILVFIPVMINGVKEKGTELDAIIVHMLGEESLDRQIIAEELEIINGYIDLNIADKYNRDMGLNGFAMNYFDTTWFMDGMYYIQREKKSVTYEEFSDAVFAVIMKQPMVFIKSRARAYYAVGAQKNTYNLFLPLVFMLGALIHSLIVKNKPMMIIMIGVLVHIAITTLSMPASFFKYFFEMWLISYVFVVIVLLEIRKIEAKKVNILPVKN
ncbi:hypothetical protein [Pseudobutyrivibrio sp. UC1225]|uniref:hypothetical protein n=1 Tax=Pseudobutyrivibrio sp. UC1225 TaxID=1798185 RepID=UPI0015A61917|nr:hypothetical protein [Pseudobutyrivibrio sp. UC1225]